MYIPSPRNLIITYILNAKVVIITQISPMSVLTRLIPAMQIVYNTYWDAGKDNLTAQNTKRTFTEGAYSASPGPLAGGEGAGCPPPQEPHSQLSALRASPLLSSTPKLVSTPLGYALTVWPRTTKFCMMAHDMTPVLRGWPLSYSRKFAAYYVRPQTAILHGDHTTRQRIFSWSTTPPALDEICDTNAVEWSVCGSYPCYVLI